MKSSEPNITRMDYGRTHGWWVRVYRTIDGEKTCTNRFFSDGTYGGKRKALAAAVKWRGRTIRKLPAPLRESHVKPWPYGYVSRTWLKRRADYHEVWQAWVRLDDGNVASSSASIERWGVAEAKRRAEAYVRRMTRRRAT